MSRKEIIDHLLGLADPDRAEHSLRYFKTAKGEYGYGDRFLGIRVPAVRQAVRRFRDTSLGDAERLLRSEYHEIRLFALLLMVHRFSRALEDERGNIYRLYLRNTKYINNWDLVDSSAHHIVGAWLEDRDRSVLDDLAGSKSIWERRIAIIATFHFIRKNQFDDTLRISELLISDKEDLIHKAVGWMLREVGKRDLSVEKAFLKVHYRNMPRTMLRYAIERFKEGERRRYLTGDV